MPKIRANLPPNTPKIYHITHINNLSSLVERGGLYSDAIMLQKGILCTAIGMNEIKQRRMEELAVRCHSGTMVGDYVPFYFCPRSIMLYLLHRGNAAGLQYAGGQRPVVHLEADLHETVQWADSQGKRWAFTASNAGAYYANFYHSLDELHRIDWEAVANDNFRDSQVKEGKQAEFLLHEFFPWHLVQVIGVRDANIAEQVKTRLSKASHLPTITVRAEWYF
jgi:hypothetical protein